MDNLDNSLSQEIRRHSLELHISPQMGLLQLFDSLLRQLCLTNHLSYNIILKRSEFTYKMQ